MHASNVRKQLNSGIHFGVLNTTKPIVVVPIRGIVPVAIGAPYVVRVVVPGAATQHTLL